VGALSRAAPALLWAALLLYLGSRPGGALPDTGLWDLPGADKVAHAVAYGVLGLLAALARGAGALTGAVAGLVVGAADEWIQSGVPGRSADLADLAADLAGAAVGGWLFSRTFRRPKRSAV